ncbi:MAG: hypothetical protein ABSE73_02470 [Planctomycetota bacterium]
MEIINWRQAQILAFCCDAEDKSPLVSDRVVVANTGLKFDEVRIEMKALETDGFLQLDKENTRSKVGAVYRVTAKGRGYNHLFKNELDKTHPQVKGSPFWKGLRVVYDEAKDVFSSALAKAAVEFAKSQGYVSNG